MRCVQEPQAQQQQQQDQGANTATPATADKTATTPADDEEPAAAPPPGAGRGSSDRRPRRGAVSAEVYSEDDAANYVKTVSSDSHCHISRCDTYDAFTPGHMSPGYMCPGRATFIRIHICRRLYVAGYKLLVRDTSGLYLGDIITIHLCHS